MCFLQFNYLLSEFFFSKIAKYNLQNHVGGKSYFFDLLYFYCFTQTCSFREIYKCVLNQITYQRRKNMQNSLESIFLSIRANNDNPIAKKEVKTRTVSEFDITLSNLNMSLQLELNRLTSTSSLTKLKSHSIKQAIKTRINDETQNLLDMLKESYESIIPYLESRIKAIMQMCLSVECSSIIDKFRELNLIHDISNLAEVLDLIPYNQTIVVLEFLLINWLLRRFSRQNDFNLN